jgi:hypothetical protein
LFPPEEISAPDRGEKGIVQIVGHFSSRYRKERHFSFSYLMKGYFSSRYRTAEHFSSRYWKGVMFSSKYKKENI